MLDEIRDKLENEIQRLTRELNVELPERIEKAVEMGDLRENAEYKSALDRQQFVQARLGHLRKRAAEISKIDVESMPLDRAGFGSKVTVYDAEFEEEETYTIVAGDYMDIDAGHVSMASPLGRALLGTESGAEVVVELPGGERRLEVREVVTLPEQIGMDD